MPRLKDDNYKYGVRAQRQKIEQAFKDWLYDRITQQELGLRVEEAAKKLQEKIDRNQLTLGDTTYVA
jgi:hypothetical protein